MMCGVGAIVSVLCHPTPPLLLCAVLLAQRSFVLLRKFASSENVGPVHIPAGARQYKERRVVARRVLLPRQRDPGEQRGCQRGGGAQGRPWTDVAVRETTLREMCRDSPQPPSPYPNRGASGMWLVTAGPGGTVSCSEPIRHASQVLSAPWRTRAGCWRSFHRPRRPQKRLPQRLPPAPAAALSRLVCRATMACLRALLLVLAIGIAHGASAVESGGSGAAPTALPNDTATQRTHNSEKPTTGSVLPKFEVCAASSFAAIVAPCPSAAFPRAFHLCTRSPRHAVENP